MNNIMQKRKNGHKYITVTARFILAMFIVLVIMLVLTAIVDVHIKHMSDEDALITTRNECVDYTENLTFCSVVFDVPVNTNQINEQYAIFAYCIQQAGVTDIYCSVKVKSQLDNGELDSNG
jgi:hypothetical protein